MSVMHDSSVPHGRGVPEVNIRHPIVPRGRGQPNFAAGRTPHQATTGQPQLVQRNGKVFYATTAGQPQLVQRNAPNHAAREQERPRASEGPNLSRSEQHPSSTNNYRRAGPNLSRSEQHQRIRYHVGSSPSSALRTGDGEWGTPAQMNFAPHPRTPSSNLQQSRADYRHPPSAGAIYYGRGGIADINQNQHIPASRNGNNSTTNFGLHHQQHYRSAAPRVPMGSPMSSFQHGAASPMVHAAMQQHEHYRNGRAFIPGAPPSSPFHHSAVPASPMNPMFSAQSATYAREQRASSQYGAPFGTPSRMPSYNYMDPRHQQLMMSHMNMMAGAMPGTPGHQVGGPPQSPHFTPSSMMFPGHSHLQHHPYNVTPNTSCTVGMSPGGEDFRFYGGGAEESSQYDHGQQPPRENASMIMANPGQGDHGGDGFNPMDSQEQQEAPHKSSHNEQTKNRPEDSSSSRRRTSNHDKKLLSHATREQSLVEYEHSQSQQSLHMQDAGRERTPSSKLGAFLEHRKALLSDHPHYSSEPTINNGVHQRTHGELNAEQRARGNLMAPPIARARAKSRDESFPPVIRNASHASLPHARTSSNGSQTPAGVGAGPSAARQTSGLLPPRLAAQLQKAQQSKRAAERRGPVHDTFQPWMRLGEKETTVCLGVRGEGSYLTVVDPGPKHKYYMCTFCDDNRLFSSQLAIRNHLNTCEKLVFHKMRNEVWPAKLKERMQSNAGGEGGLKNGDNDAKEFPAWATAQTVSLGDNPALTKLQNAEIDMVEKLTLPKEVEQNRWPSKLESERMARQLEKMNEADAAAAGAGGSAPDAGDAIGSGGEGKNRKRTPDNKTGGVEAGQSSGEGKKASTNDRSVADGLPSEVDPLADPLGYMQRSIANALQAKLQGDLNGKKGHGTMSQSELIAMISSEPGVLAARQRLSRLGILDEYWEAAAAAAYRDTIGSNREFVEGIENSKSIPSSTGNDPEKNSAHMEQQEERRRIAEKRTRELQDWAKRNQGGAVRMGRTFEITETATCHGDDAVSKIDSTSSCNAVSLSAASKEKGNHKDDNYSNDDKGNTFAAKNQTKLQQEKTTCDPKSSVSSTARGMVHSALSVQLRANPKSSVSSTAEGIVHSALSVQVRANSTRRDAETDAQDTKISTSTVSSTAEGMVQVPLATTEQRSTRSKIFKKQAVERVGGGDMKIKAAATPSETPAFPGSSSALSCPRLLTDVEQLANTGSSNSITTTSSKSKPNKRKRLTPHPSDGSHPEELADRGPLPSGGSSLIPEVTNTSTAPPPKPKAKARGKRKIAKTAAQGPEQSAWAKRRGVTGQDHQTAGHGGPDAASSSTSSFLAALLGRERASNDDRMTALIHQSSPWKGSSDVEETAATKDKSKNERDIKLAEVEIKTSGTIVSNVDAAAGNADAESKTATATASTTTPSPEKHTPNASVLETQQDQDASRASSSSSHLQNGEANQITAPAPKKRRGRAPKRQVNAKNRNGHDASATTSASATSLENQAASAKTQASGLGATKDRNTEEEQGPDQGPGTAAGPTVVAKENAKPKAKGRAMKVAKAKAKRASKTSVKCHENSGNKPHSETCVNKPDPESALVEVVEGAGTTAAHGAQPALRDESENLQKGLPEQETTTAIMNDGNRDHTSTHTEILDLAVVLVPPSHDEEPKEDSYRLPSDFESDEDFGLQPKCRTRTKNISKKNKKKHKAQSSRLDLTSRDSSTKKQEQGGSRVILVSANKDILGTSSSSRKEEMTAPHPPPTSCSKHIDEDEEDVNPYADSQDDVNPYADTFEDIDPVVDERALTTTRIRSFINAACHQEQGCPTSSMNSTNMTRLFANTTPEPECGPRSPPIPKEQAEAQLASVQCGQQGLLHRKQQSKGAEVPHKMTSCTSSTSTKGVAKKTSSASSTSNTHTAVARRRMPLWSPTKASPVTKKMRPSHSPLLPSSSSKILAKNGERGNKVPETPVSFRPEARSLTSPSVSALLSVHSHGRMRKLGRATDKNGKDNRKGGGSGWTSCTNTTPGPLSSKAMWAESGTSRDYSARKEIDFEEEDIVLKA
ncbi:unnamed protein product [Amoebophrya sp. A25]|nr:unnamed protein product [Amoebophrya sp. A25]|eukprot:GSA25T00023140001.1